MALQFFTLRSCADVVWTLCVMDQKGVVLVETKRRCDFSRPWRARMEQSMFVSSCKIA